MLYTDNKWGTISASAVEIPYQSGSTNNRWHTASFHKITILTQKNCKEELRKYTGRGENGRQAEDLGSADALLPLQGRYVNPKMSEFNLDEAIIFLCN
jgi:hypothetical protein